MICYNSRNISLQISNCNILCYIKSAYMCSFIKHREYVSNYCSYAADEAKEKINKKNI